MPPVVADPQLAELKQQMALLEKRVERGERIDANLGRCIKAIWFVIAPVVTGLLVRYLSSL